MKNVAKKYLKIKMQKSSSHIKMSTDIDFGIDNE